MERIRKYEPLWGEWKVVKRIGEGSFGAVYEVEKTVAGNTSYSAVKLISFLNSEMLKGVMIDETISAEELEEIKKEAAKKSVREAALMDKLQGRANIVTIYDYGIYPNEKTTDVLIRMELLTNLRNYIKTIEVDADFVVQLGLDVCKALESCEKENIIHRDIKPDNIFINKDGDFKLGDFGLSRKMNKSASASLRKSKGTPMYMPPEAFGWESSVDNRSDIYSLGIVMYQLINSGNIPFCKDMDDFDEVDVAIGKRVNQKEEIPMPSGCQKELWTILQKACAHEKQDRYQSVAEMRKELQSLKNELDKGKEEKVDKPKKKYIFFGLILLLLIMMMYTAQQFMSSRTSKLPEMQNQQSETDRVPESFENYDVGDNVSFGVYPQNTASEDDKQPIEWIVLKKEADRMLVISKYALDGKQYNEKDKSVTWETSGIRRWMNETFYEAAFNSKEQEKILTTTVKAEDNSKYGTEAGEDTEDKVFLLSIDEAENLFFSREDRQCKPTEYAVSQGVWKHEDMGNCNWWLRSPGYNSFLASGVYSNGYAFHLGSNVCYFNLGVRPAMWLNLGS